MAYLRKTLHSLGGGTPVGPSPFQEALAYAQFMRAAQPRSIGDGGGGEMGGDGASDSGDDAVLRMALERMRQEGQDRREASRQQGYEAYRNTMLQRADADRAMRMKQFEAAAQDRQANSARQSAMFQNSEAWRRHNAMRQDERDAEGARRYEQGRLDRLSSEARRDYKQAAKDDKELLKDLKLATYDASANASKSDVGPNEFVSSQAPFIEDYQTAEARQRALDMLSSAAADVTAARRRGPNSDEAAPGSWRSFFPALALGTRKYLHWWGLGDDPSNPNEWLSSEPPEDNGQALLAALYRQHRELGGR